MRTVPHCPRHCVHVKHCFVPQRIYSPNNCSCSAARGELVDFSGQDVKWENNSAGHFMPTHELCFGTEELNFISPGTQKCCSSFAQVVASEGFLGAVCSGNGIFVLVLQTTCQVPSATLHKRCRWFGQVWNAPTQRRSFMYYKLGVMMFLNPAQSCTRVSPELKPCQVERGYLPWAKPLQYQKNCFRSTPVSLEEKAWRISRICSPPTNSSANPWSEFLPLHLSVFTRTPWNSVKIFTFSPLYNHLLAKGKSESKSTIVLYCRKKWCRFISFFKH